MTSGERQLASLLPEVAEPDEETDMDVAATLAALARMKRADRLPDDFTVATQHEGFAVTAKAEDLVKAALDSSL